MRLNVAKTVIQALLVNNVQRIYGIIGTSILDFLDALYDYRDKINFITTRHEQVAVSAADAEARVSGNLGVAAVHAGPGFMNSLLSLAIAFKDRSPLLLITGGVRRRLKNTDAWLEVNQKSIAESICKYYARIENPNETSSILKEAINSALKSPRGPSVIEVAEDIWNEEIEIEEGEIDEFKPKMEESFPTKEELSLILNKLYQAKRPLIFVSGEACINNRFKQEALLELAEKTDSYIAVSGNAKGACSDENPRCLGRVGFGGGSLLADKALESCDFLLVLGNEFDDITTYAYTLLPSGDVYVISLDPAVEKRPKYYEVIKRDPISFLNLLSIEARKMGKKENDEWNRMIRKYKDEWEAVKEEALARRYERTANPSKFFKLLDERLPKNRIITGGQGVHILYAYSFLKIYKPGSFLAANNLGAMGFAFPAAIGAKLANPNSEVVAIVGDGDFMMTVQDLETLKREKIPVKTIVVNDNSYRVLYLRQMIQKSGKIYETLIGNPDIVKLSESFGIPAIRVDKDEKIEEAVNALVNSKDEPFLVELLIDPNDIPPFNIQQSLKMSM